MKTTFRDDINGLRALSVIAVILFHTGLETFKGGFLGVDVFFVISGFLITTNIIKQRNENKFSIISFYDKRIRRIMPALFFTLLITSIVAFFLMLPYDLKNFGQSLFASSLGGNNILLYLTTGYWSHAAEMKPLYHTWSLGVEEQYYLLIPLIFIIFSKNRTKIILYIIYLLFIASWMLSFRTNNNEFNFLMIFTRLWQLCAGTILAIHIDKFKQKSSLLMSVGILLIIISCIAPRIISSNQAIYNLMPTLGTFLVIAYSPREGWLNTACSNKLISIIGLSSYSIYLLHQPMIAFLRLSSEVEVSIYMQLFMGCLSIPLGVLMWKYIEKPFRDKTKVNNKIFYSSMLCCFIVFTVGGFITHQSSGFQNLDINKKYRYGVHPWKYADKSYELVKDKFTTSGSKMLIIGDSFARDFYNCIKEAELTRGFEVVYQDKFAFDSKVIRNLLSSADCVFFVSSTGMINQYFDINELTEKRVKIKEYLDRYANGKYLFIGTKNYGVNNNFIKLMNWDNAKNHMVDICKNTIKANKIEGDIFKDSYIDIISLTSVGGKTKIFTDKNQFISFDCSHITKQGACYLGRLLKNRTDIADFLIIRSVHR